MTTCHVHIPSCSHPMFTSHNDVMFTSHNDDDRGSHVIGMNMQCTKILYCILQKITLAVHMWMYTASQENK